VAGAEPEWTPTPYTKIESGRSAVTAGLSWRREPAAAFRAFGAGLRPAAICASLNRSKPASGK
jgi:hypothetical protein